MTSEECEQVELAWREGDELVMNPKFARADVELESAVMLGDHRAAVRAPEPRPDLGGEVTR